MANTWNKIKNKLKWKKSRSKKKKKHRKSRKNNSSSHKNTSYSPIKSQQNTTTTTRNIQSLPTNRSIHKKKSSKSNIFGCLTNVQKENMKQYNLQKPPKQNHIDTPTLNNNYTSNSPQPQHRYTACSKSSGSCSNSSCSTLSIPTPKMAEPEQLEIAGNHSIIHHKSKSIPLAVPIGAISSPSKSKTAYTENRESSKYILENQSAICCGSICSDSMGGGIKNGATPKNTQYDAICMTPTPNTTTTNGVITPCTSSSEWINGGNTNDYDIYEGVLEVENDKIIEEGDMSNYYYIHHGHDGHDDDDDDHKYNNHHHIDDIDDDDDDDIDNDDDMEQENKYRDSVVIPSPRDIVGEFALYSPTKMDERRRGSMEEELREIDIERDIEREDEMEQIENGLLSLDAASLIAAESQDILSPITPNVHGIIHDQQIMAELNDMLKRNGCDNPDVVLKELWDEQIEIDRGPQILQIIQCLRQKKKIKLADNFNLNGHETPSTSIPIERADVAIIPGLQSLNIGDPSIGSREDEDDDIKYTAHDTQQQHNIIELGEQLLFDKMVNSMDFNDEDQITPPHQQQQQQHHHHSLQCNNKPIIIYHEHSSSPHSGPHSVQYHEGPIRVTNESNNSLQNVNIIRSDESNGRKTGLNTASSTKSSTKSSNSDTKSSRSKPKRIGNNSSNTPKSRRSGSTISDEPEWKDGDIFHDKYIVGMKINEGGFGAVWKIRDNNLYSKCVKIMPLGKDEKSQTRRKNACIREFKMTEKAFSDEIVEVELFIDDIYDIQEPKAYLIMPYFEGKDLFEFIDEDDYLRKISVQTILHIFYKIAEKLYDLHYFKKIVHGDLKPENVMILQNHKTDEIEVEIIDYGIAKSIRNLSSDEKYLKSKGHFGTKGYVAPELMKESKYNRKIDVFSAGVVLYNMVTECCLFPKGQKYYRLTEGEYYKYLKKKFKVIKRKKIVIDILHSCLAYDPEERLDVKQLIQRYFHQKR